jgi:hypothetical protein
MVFDTPAGIDWFRLNVIISAMSLYLKTGIKANRAYTPTNMRMVATEYTGKVYPKSRKGLESAYADLLAVRKHHTFAQK